MTGWSKTTSGAALVSLGMLAMAGCSDDPPKNAARAGQTRSAPPPVSAQDYGAALATAVGPVDEALKGLGGAKSYKGLAGRVQAVEQAAQQSAAKLPGLAVPPEAAADHARLVAAFQQFQTDLGGTRGKVEGRQVCTGAAARAAVGDAEGTTALRGALETLRSTLPGSTLSLGLPEAGQKVGERPGNGKFLRSGSRGGRGSLSIDNGGSTDAVVTLAKGGKAAISVYVHKGKKATVSGVSDGSYSVYYTTGARWDGKAKAFGSDCDFRRFDEKLKFNTWRDGNYIRWRTWKISLHAVSGGSARTSDVDPDGIPG